jgi:hypothetical protein
LIATPTESIILIQDLDENIKSYLQHGKTVDIGICPLNNCFSWFSIGFMSIDYPFGLLKYEGDDKLPTREDLEKRHTVSFLVYLFFKLRPSRPSTAANRRSWSVCLIYGVQLM